MIGRLILLEWTLTPLFLYLAFTQDTPQGKIAFWAAGVVIVGGFEILISRIKSRSEVTITLKGEEKITFLTRPYTKDAFTHFRPAPDSHVRFMAMASKEIFTPIQAEADYPNPMKIPATVTFRKQTMEVVVNRMIARCHCDRNDPHWTGHFFYGDFQSEENGEFLSGVFAFVIGSFPQAKEKIRRAIPDCSLEELPAFEILVTVHTKAP